MIVPAGDSISCVAASAEELFLIVNQPKDQLHVYDIASCKFKRALTVSGLQYSAHNDLAFCTARQCLYLSDYDGRRVHRLKLPTVMSKWSIAEHPYGVSVSRENTVLVTCRQAKKLLEYSGGGRAIVPGVTNPWHGVQTSADRFLVARRTDTTGTRRAACS